MLELLSYLHKTGKYELGLLCGGMPLEHDDYRRWPWKCYGAVPSEQEQHAFLSRFPENERAGRQNLVYYGAAAIDKVVDLFKPDVYVGVEDFWGVSFAINSRWWNKISCMIHWTADSLPIYTEALEKAHLINHHYVWSSFATTEFHRLASVLEAEIASLKSQLATATPDKMLSLQNRIQELSVRASGYRRVKTLRGTVNTDVFCRLPDFHRKALRESQGIADDEFCIGFLSRNQLRKLIPNLLEGYALFKRKNPKVKSRLIFYTHFGEGWNIPKLAAEAGATDVYATYKCRATGQFYVLPYTGQGIDNPKTGHKNSLYTVSLTDQLPPQQINEWYNMLDCFCLPITSGGQERAIQEAKLCELVTLANPYSCGVDNCAPEAASVILDFDLSNREFMSEFKKAAVYPHSIAQKLEYVSKMPVSVRRKMGEKARKWVLNNFSIEVVGRQYEEILDSMPFADWSNISVFQRPNPNAVVPDIADNLAWIKSLYRTILDMEVGDDDSGVRDWLNSLNKGVPRENVVAYFRNTAVNLKATPIDLIARQLDNTGRKRFLLVAKESIGDVFYVSAMLKGIKAAYPEYDVYFATNKSNFDLLKGNPYLYKIIEYHPVMDNEIAMTGQSDYKGLFDAYSNATVGTQYVLNYLTNDRVKLPAWDK